MCIKIDLYPYSTVSPGVVKKNDKRGRGWWWGPSRPSRSALVSGGPGVRLWPGRMHECSLQFGTM